MKFQNRILAWSLLGRRRSPAGGCSGVFSRGTVRGFSPMTSWKISQAAREGPFYRRPRL